MEQNSVKIKALNYLVNDLYVQEGKYLLSNSSSSSKETSPARDRKGVILIFQRTPDNSSPLKKN